MKNIRGASYGILEIILETFSNTIKFADGNKSKACLYLKWIENNRKILKFFTFIEESENKSIIWKTNQKVNSFFS